MSDKHGNSKPINITLLECFWAERMVFGIWNIIANRRKTIYCNTASASLGYKNHITKHAAKINNTSIVSRVLYVKDHTEKLFYFQQALKCMSPVIALHVPDTFPYRIYKEKTPQSPEKQDIEITSRRDLTHNQRHNYLWDSLCTWTVLNILYQD